MSNKSFSVNIKVAFIKAITDVAKGKLSPGFTQLRPYKETFHCFTFTRIYFRTVEAIYI